MSTQVTAPTVARRVVARAGVGLWRHKGGILVGLALVAAATGYMAYGATEGTPALASGGATAAASSDCADTAMAAIAKTSSGSAQQAYQCMDPSFQQRVPEDTFVQQIDAQAPTDVNSVARVGDYHPEAGGSMVYYAVNTSGQSVGYIVYVGQDGKVLKIE
jgi:hypothetical protein